MAIGFTFNSVTIPGVNSYGGRVNSSIDSLQKIGRDGVTSQTGRLGGRPITISGTIARSSEDLMRSAWATLLAALYDDDGGSIKADLTAFTDREITCQLADHSVQFGTDKANMHACDYTLAFWADFPFWKATSSTQQVEENMSTGGTMTILAANMGDAACWPTSVVVTAGAAQLTSDIVITNTTTSEVWTFGAALAATKVLSVDMENHDVTNDSTDAIDDVTHASSEWWMLRGASNNVIQLDFGGGANDATMTITWIPRYFNL